ncbi:MAG: 30S ribosomal protein S6 [Patescibacteria group bacterium]|nr:30S ribosomal protein S6 [Patescibacteria group bacterium]
MKEYELTYLITSSFTKEEAESHHEKIKKGFSKKAKLLEKEQFPARKTLAYEINKEGEGYLASFGFSAEEEDVLILNNDLKKDDSIIRHIITKKRTRVIKQERKRGVKKEDKKTSAPKKIELSKIDEKIEEIA